MNSSNISAEIKWLRDRLPPIEPIRVRSEADLYGISHLIAAKVGRHHPPRSFTTWTHGWIYDEVIVHPRQLTAWGEADDTHLVATIEHAKALQNLGFTKTEAVGLPFIYAGDYKDDRADNAAIDRIPGSLLVMPHHSLPYTEHDWNEQAYVDRIVQLKPYFSTIVVCLHNSCVSKGLWRHTFEQNGIPWITGASVSDRHALLRMHRIFKSFEYMTTNSLSSHIPYAAYCGCKVSIYGALNPFEASSFKGYTWIAEYPEIIKIWEENSQESALRRRFPMLFKHPEAAVTMQAWAEEILGLKYQRKPEELAELLWLPLDRQIYTYVKWGIRFIKRPGLAARLQEKVLGLLRTPG